MTEPINIFAKISTVDPSVSFNPAQIVTFRAAVAGALARQAAEVLGPSGYEVLAYAPQFQLTVGFEIVEGWFIRFDNVTSYGLNAKVGYMLTNLEFEDTDYEVVVTIKFAFDGHDTLEDAGRDYHDPDIGQELDEEDQ